MVILYLLVGMLIGGFLTILLIRRFLTRRVIPLFDKAAELRKTGTRIEATVTRIDLYPHRTVPKQVSILVAQWQQPQTGKCLRIGVRRQIRKNSPSEVPYQF